MCPPPEGQMELPSTADTEQGGAESGGSLGDSPETRIPTKASEWGQRLPLTSDRVLGPLAPR